MNTATVFNHAGGAGKTSITLNVGRELALMGQRVLLIDLDPQANLTGWLGVREVDPAQTVAGVATARAELPEPVQVHGLHLIPSHISLSLAEPQMMGRVGVHQALHAALEQVRDRYDVVLIDSPPSVGQLAILGALAAQHMIVPVPTSQKGMDALPGLHNVFQEYRTVRRDLTVALYVPTFYDARRLLDRSALRQIQQHLRPVASALPERKAVWGESAAAGLPVADYAPGSPVHQDVQRLAAEVAQALGLGVAVTR